MSEIISNILINLSPKIVLIILVAFALVCDVVVLLYSVKMSQKDAVSTLKVNSSFKKFSDGTLMAIHYALCSLYVVIAILLSFLLRWIMSWKS